MKKNKNIIVFGGSGFLGSHVSDALSDKGHNVTIFDVKKSLYLRKDQKMIVGDILNEQDVLDALKEQDIVYNFAGIADIDECYNKPYETIKYNVLGNLNILNCSYASKVTKFLFASSAYVYSNSGSFYRISKQSSEQLIESFYNKYGLSYCILRYGSLYGERSDNRNSIYNLLYKAVNESKIEYKGLGSETREFIHVKDAASLSVLALEEIYKNKILMLTGTKSMKYDDLFDMVNEIFNDKLKISKVPNESKSHYRMSPYSFNPKMALKLTNNPHIDLGQGLLDLIDEIYKNNNPELNKQFGIYSRKKE